MDQFQKRLEQNLVMISSISPGDTICKFQDNYVLCQHSMFTGIIRRFWTKETKYDTIMYIENIINTAVHNNMFINTDTRQGILNLKMTYCDYPDIADRVNNLLNFVNNRQAHQYYSFMTPVNYDKNPEPVNDSILELISDSRTGDTRPRETKPIDIPPKRLVNMELSKLGSQDQFQDCPGGSGFPSPAF